MTSTLSGREIKLTYEIDKEQEVCELLGLTHQPKNVKAKRDAFNNNENWSIKNARSKSTQVFLTTQSKMIERFGMPEEFKLFFGDKQKNRFNLNEIPSFIVESYLEYLNSNTITLIKYAVAGDNEISHIAFRDLNNNKLHTCTVDSIMDKVANAKWVIGKKFGSFQLVRDGQVLFHIQREGKGSSPHNVLFHIHLNAVTK
jgi:hypothetical protein